MVDGIMFRHTSLDPITITIGSEEQTIDFISETITVDGVSRPWTSEDRVLWPDAAQIAVYQAEDAALVNAYGERDVVLNNLKSALNATALHPLPTPEEQTVLNSQITQALTDFTQVSNPDTDMVTTAASLIAWRASIL